MEIWRLYRIDFKGPRIETGSIGPNAISGQVKLNYRVVGTPRRGKVQAQIAEDKAASAHAATLLQAQMRGKAARSASPS